MVIALLTDFGDFYPGVMKGIIRKMSGAEVVDITHSVSPQNIVEGAFLLYSSYRFFPNGTVFVSVVDPGVGGKRRAIAVKTRDYWFVAPDNGLVYPSASENGIEEIYVIGESVSGISGTLSSTFHGRDIFAPAGALIHDGKLDKRHFQKADPEIVKLELFDPEIEGREISCRVLHIDRFGNAVTNLRRKDLEDIDPEGFVFNEIEIPVVERYEDVDAGEVLALFGSFETLELSVRDGNFSEKYNVRYGELRLRWF